MLRGSSQYTLRYHLTAMQREAINILNLYPIYSYYVMSNWQNKKAISCKQHLSLSLILRTTSNYPTQNKYHRYCIVEDNLQVPNDAFEDNFSNIYIYKSLILYEMQLCFPSSPSGAKKHWPWFIANEHNRCTWVLLQDRWYPIVTFYAADGFYLWPRKTTRRAPCPMDENSFQPTDDTGSR